MKRWATLIGVTLFGGAAAAALAVWLWSRETGGVQSKTLPGPDISEAKAKAEQGDADAQNELGQVYARGQGVRQDFSEAAKWYQKAAAQGYAAAQNNLAEMYQTGQGVAQNDAEAMKWYRRAAEQGHVDAQYNLAVMLAVGRGGPLDDAEAVKWYRSAAGQGDGLAQYNMGERCVVGRSVPKDEIEAYKWLSLAAAHGIADAAKSRDQLKSKLTREQIRESERRMAASASQKPARHP